MGFGATLLARFWFVVGLPTRQVGFFCVPCIRAPPKSKMVALERARSLHEAIRLHAIVASLYHVHLHQVETSMDGPRRTS